MEKQTLPNSTGILVLGILSIVTCCFYGVVGLALGIVALVMAKKSIKLYKEAPENYTGYSNIKTGKVLAIIGIILNILLLIAIVGVISFFGYEALQNPELMEQRLQELQ